MPVIKVKGLASGKEWSYEYDPSELDEDLLKWLRKHDVTVASSCDGEGVCRKCSIQNDWLTCLTSLREFLEMEKDATVKISYL